MNEVCSLPALLEAIQEQRTDHEVIVVDGGSTDGTLEVARDHEVRTLAASPRRGVALSIRTRASHGEVPSRR